MDDELTVNPRQTHDKPRLIHYAQFMTQRTTSNQEPDPWTDLCALNDLPAEGAHYVALENRAVAVLCNQINEASSSSNGSSNEQEANRLRVDSLRVLDDSCPHAGASLSAGYVEDGCIICPWHHWAFDVNTGVCPDSDAYTVRVYEVRVVDGRVQAKLE